MSTPAPIDPDLLRARLVHAVEPVAPSPDALRQIRAGIRSRKLRLSFGTGAGALLIAGGVVAAALFVGSPGNPQTAPVTEAPGQTTATTAPDSPTQAPTTSASLSPTTEPAPTSVVLLPSSTPSAAPATPTTPVLSTPAELVTALAGKKDFGTAKGVVATTGGPCLLVDRLVQLSGAPASAWVAKHPLDASDNDLPAIADEDGPSLVCLPLSSKPTIRMPVNPPPHQGIVMYAATVDQLRQFLTAPSVAGEVPPWFTYTTWYHWHYDAKGAVDQVTGWWTP